MTFTEATRERVQAATGFIPTAVEQDRIDADAQRSAEVLFRDVCRPALAHRNIARALCRELIAKHLSYPPRFRLAKRQVLDMDRTPPDDPWVVGTKFLVVYSGAPQFVHQLDYLEDWRRVIDRYVRDSPHRCDLRVTTGCTDGLADVLSVCNFKRGQWVTLHRGCDPCLDWLRYGTGKPNHARLNKLPDLYP